MMELLDEITEIPFEMFQEKWEEMKPGNYDWNRAKKEWFYMKEPDRLEAFKFLASNHPIVRIMHGPEQYLSQFNLPF